MKTFVVLALLTATLLASFFVNANAQTETITTVQEQTTNTINVQGYSTGVKKTWDVVLAMREKTANGLDTILFKGMSAGNLLMWVILILVILVVLFLITKIWWIILLIIIFAAIIFFILTFVLK